MLVTRRCVRKYIDYLTLYYSKLRNICPKVQEIDVFRLPDYRFTPPQQGSPANIRINLILREIIETLVYVFTAEGTCVYLHSNFRGGRSRLSKVIVFWYQSKARIQLPISHQ